MYKLLQDGPQTVRDKNEVTNDPGLRDRRASRKLLDILLRFIPRFFLFLSISLANLFLGASERVNFRGYISLQADPLL